uniref:beta-D-galactosyl-(1->3)-N-acetyl-beta-D-galactosaminide alpha-2,3-sialyltransferase n=2 Tax=Cebus imitator TaxID=2715852 RepID=A0A2K5QNC0_CEBIM
MKRWQIFVLWIFWVLILWLMAPYLDLTPESAPQGKRMYLVPRRCNCPRFGFRTFRCPSETLNCSSCPHPATEWNWLDVCSRKTMGYLMRTRESMTSDTVLWWLGMNSGSKLGKLWKKLFKVIPRLSVNDFDFYCGTCVLLGHSQILQGSRLGNDINQYPVVFRNASDQGSWMQLKMLLRKLSELVWTSGALSDEILEDGPVP